MSTQAVTLKNAPFPQVHQIETQIDQLERQLQTVKQKEELKAQQRGALLRQSATQENNEHLNKVETEIDTIEAEKKRLRDRIDELKKEVVDVEAEARKSKAELKAAHDDRKKIKGEIEDLDEKLSKVVKPVIDLIQQRQQIIHNSEKVEDIIQTLTGKLRWHPSKIEAAPPTPEILEKLQQLLPRQIVKWRGR